MHYFLLSARIPYRLHADNESGIHFWIYLLEKWTDGELAKSDPIKLLFVLYHYW